MLGDNPRRVSFGKLPEASDPNFLNPLQFDDDDDDEWDDEEDAANIPSYNEEGSEVAFSKMKRYHSLQEAKAADRLSMRLLQVPDDDEDEEFRILRESLNLAAAAQDEKPVDKRLLNIRALERMCTMISVSVVVLMVICIIFYLGVEFVGPPSQPIGPYQIIERQEGMEFFNYYTFYEGRDSAGSNGFNTYVSMPTAQSRGIVNVTYETSEYNNVNNRRQQRQSATAPSPGEPFIYMSSAPTPAGPRDSIRLEGKRRFNRGLFIIDLRHMPAGCGTWPAFWLTDEANWPVNGEIDIVEGVNFQNVAKTALHATKGCSMDDVPQGLKTGGWDTATGIPNKKTGIPDMTLRYATNCFVYDPHQWLNQGCVAVDTISNGTSLGIPVNQQGGGVYVLEWDPINRHIRAWVFSPHSQVPENLRLAMETVNWSLDDRVAPDPELWPLPYGYFPIGDQTSCPASHFRNMRLVLNLAFCGSVSGNRFQLDCPIQSKLFSTCNQWIDSNPDELAEAYWKIRGVYVYEREWQRAWL